MNSLKKIAAVSGIICAITLVAAIILTPFAVSASVDVYNKLVTQAESSADQYWMDCSLDSAVTDLTLADNLYYGRIHIKESADKQIHIRNLDRGFEYIRPEVSLHGSRAEVSFHWVNDPKLTRENIVQLLAAEWFTDYRHEIIVELPASVSLHFAEKAMDNLFYNVDLDFKGFANYEELQSRLDTWIIAEEAHNTYQAYLSFVDEELQQIQILRYELADNAESTPSAAEFQLSCADTYVDIRNRRSDLLKRSYNLRKTYSTQPAVNLESDYLEMNNLIEELCAQEEQYDLLSAKVSEARAQLESGEITAEQFSSLANTCFTQQVELDLSISKKRDTVIEYLQESPDSMVGDFPESETDQSVEKDTAATSEVTSESPSTN